METIEFNGKQYSMDSAIFATFQNGVKTGYPTFAADKQDAILEGMLKAFLKPGKEYAKIERQSEIKAMCDTTNNHDTIKPLASKVSAAFKTYGKALFPIEKALGAKATVRDTGTVFFAVPIDETNPITLGAIYGKLGMADVEISVHEPDGKVYAKISGDVPEAAKAKAAYTAALGELDTAITAVIDRTNLKVSFNTTTGLVELADATQKQAGTPRGNTGPTAWGGTVKWNGNEYSGSHLELYNALKAAGFQFADYVAKHKVYSYIVVGRISGIEVVERFTGEKAA